MQTTLVWVVLPSGKREVFTRSDTTTTTWTPSPGTTGIFTHDPTSTTEPYRYRHQDGTLYFLNPLGYPIRIRALNGTEYLLTYDATYSDMLKTVIGTAGRTWTFNYAIYDSSGLRIRRLINMQGPDGQTLVTYTYMGDDLTRVDYPDGTYLTYQYDANHNLTAITDSQGRILEQATYDTSDRVTSWQSGDSANRVTLTYGSNITTVTNSQGQQTQYYYTTLTNLNNQKRITQITGPGCATCGATNVTYTYDANGYKASETNALGVTTSYVNDARGNVLSKTEAAGTPQARTTTFTYNDLNQVTSVTAPDGGMTRYTYDANGNLLSVTNPAGETTAFAYNTQGQLTALTDPTRATTTLTYDAYGNVATVTDPLGRTASFTYDSQGNLLMATDALGRTSQYAYDLRSRLTQVLDALTAATRYGYDGSGNLTAVTDAKSQSTNYAYDGASRLTQVVNALGQGTSYAYDTESNLTRRTDANGRTTTYTYDSSNRLTQITAPDASTTTFSYDAASRLTQASNSAATATFIYDPLNQVTQIRDQAGRAISYTYDAAGRRIARTDPLSAQAGGSGVTSYTYDSAGRLLTLTDPWNRTWTFGYDAAGRRTWLQRPNGLSTTYRYDAAGQLRSIDHAGLGLWQYSYDAVGNRTQMSTPSGTHTYSYDATDRLTSAAHPTSPIETYSYDPVGNRLTDATASYSYDAANRLLNRGRVEYTWDSNGNLTGRRRGGAPATYRYDGDNRLLEVQRGGGRSIARFTYDPFGRRVSKTTSTGTIYYVYDGEDILAEVDGTGNILSYYVHGPGIDEPLAMIRGGQTYYYHADALGTITHLTNASGAVAQSYEYDSFGNITGQNGSLNQPYTYTAREWDTETGLYYYRARYYDPQVGRFISEDPIGLAGGINFYAYVEGNPVNWVDPKGLESLKACGTRIYLRERGYLGGKDDKYKHCVVACRIMQECGTFGAVVGIFYKEYQDYWEGTGTPEWADVTAGFKGLRCPKSQNCYIHCLYEGFGGSPIGCCPGVR